LTTITIDTFSVQDIPVLTMSEAGADRQPVVFFVHGFTGEKTSALMLGYELAEAGFTTVSFDAPMHGDRYDPHLGAMLDGEGDYVYPIGTGLDVFLMLHEIIVRAAEDLETLIAYFDATGTVDTGRIGLTGFSMGGFTTFYAAAHNPRIQAAVPIAGIPGFADRWRDVVLESSAYEKWAEAMAAVEAETRERTAVMARIDPFDGMARFAPKPLMMICGDKDLDAPKHYSLDLYRMLKPRYADHPERLRLNIHDEAGHEFTHAMRQDVRAWFARYLLDPARV
jgi:dienelactone hydrolase